MPCIMPGNTELSIGFSWIHPFANVLSWTCPSSLTPIQVSPERNFSLNNLSKISEKVLLLLNLALEFKLNDHEVLFIKKIT